MTESALAATPCRCGYIPTPDVPHPCHGLIYRCRQPATQRLYNPRMVAVAGHQLKFDLSETWACDECWADFNANKYHDVLADPLRKL